MVECQRVEAGIRIVAFTVESPVTGFTSRICRPPKSSTHRLPDDGLKASPSMCGLEF